jgi:chromosomal replication initiation ATPase DnaA
MKLHPQAEIAVTVVEKFSHTDRSKFMNTCRRADLVMLRWMVYCILRHFFKWTLQRIASELGQCTHHNVHYGIHQLERMYEVDKVAREDIVRLLKRAAVAYIDYWEKRDRKEEEAQP